jgi:hypothetical protein
MIYAKKTLATDPRWKGRAITIGLTPVGSYKQTREAIPVPDDVVLCNGCNRNIAETEPKEGYLIYLSLRDLEHDQPYDVYCPECTARSFPKAEKV